MPTTWNVSPRRACAVMALVVLTSLAADSSEAQTLARDIPQCGAYFEDATTSVVEREIAAVRTVFVDSLGPMVARGGPGCWRLYHFKADSFHARETGELRLTAFRPPRCDAGRTSELAAIIREVAAREKSDRQQECDRLLHDAQRAYQDEMSRVLTRALASFSNASASGRCTALIDLLERISLDGDPSLTVAVVATDGRESCRHGSVASIAAPAASRHVVMVIVGVKGDNRAGASYLELARSWKRIAPWIEVVPSFGVRTALNAIK